MNVLVLNTTHELKEVAIVDENGRPDSVNIMPRSRVHLKKGCVVNPSWAAQHPEVRVVNPEPVASNEGEQE